MNRKIASILLCLSSWTLGYCADTVSSRPSSASTYSSSISTTIPASYRNLVTPMTNFGSPYPFKCYANFWYDPSTKPQYAFDGNLSTYWRAGTWSGFTNIDYGFDKPQLVTGYALKQYNGYPDDIAYRMRYPSAWSLVASNDESSWAVLHSTTGFVWTSSTTVALTTFNNTKPYRYYRIVATASAAGTTWMVIGDIEFYHTTTENIARTTTISTTDSGTVLAQNGFPLLSVSEYGGISVSTEATGTGLDLRSGNIRCGAIISNYGNGTVYITTNTDASYGNGADSVLIGQTLVQNSDKVYGVGNNISLNGTQGSYVGWDLHTNAAGGCMMGYKNAYNGLNCNIMGYYNLYNKAACTVMGSNSQRNGPYGNYFGDQINNCGGYSNVLGHYGFANSSSTALGAYARANAYLSTAVGYGTINNSTNTISMGSYLTTIPAIQYTPDFYSVGVTTPIATHIEFWTSDYKKYISTGTANRFDWKQIYP